jgi:hypothetical protein
LGYARNAREPAADALTSGWPARSVGGTLSTQELQSASSFEGDRFVMWFAQIQQCGQDAFFLWW